MMDILIESTKDFETDLEKLSNTEKFKIIKEMNRNFEFLSDEKDKDLFYANTEQFRHLKLNHDYDSTIYSLQINEEQRIILTIDDDPIFGCTLITLFRLIIAEDAPKAYNAVAEFIYQDFTVEEEQELEVNVC